MAHYFVPATLAAFTMDDIALFAGLRKQKCSCFLVVCFTRAFIFLAFAKLNCRDCRFRWSLAFLMEPFLCIYFLSASFRLIVRQYLLAIINSEWTQTFFCCFSVSYPLSTQCLPLKFCSHFPTFQPFQSLNNSDRSISFRSRTQFWGCTNLACPFSTRFSFMLILLGNEGDFHTQLFHFSIFRIALHAFFCFVYLFQATLLGIRVIICNRWMQIKFNTAIITNVTHKNRWIRIWTNPR